MSNSDNNKTTYNSTAAKVELAIVAGDLRDLGMHDHADLIDAIILTHMNRARPGHATSRVVTADKIRQVLRAYSENGDSINAMSEASGLYPSDVERLISRAVSTGLVTQGKK